MKKLNTKICHVLESSNTIFFDVDDTLILWGTLNKPYDGPYNTPHPCLVAPITVDDPHMAGHKMTFRPHLTHCHLLIRNFHQGRTVVVWSAAGADWAQLIVKLLGLEPYVSLILEKPSIYVDDIDMKDWKPKRVYIEHDVEAKG